MPVKKSARHASPLSNHYQVVRVDENSVTTAYAKDLDAAYDAAYELARKVRNRQVDIYDPTGEHVGCVGIISHTEPRPRSRRTDRRTSDL